MTSPLKLKVLTSCVTSREKKILTYGIEFVQFLAVLENSVLPMG